MCGELADRLNDTEKDLRAAVEAIESAGEWIANLELGNAVEPGWQGSRDHILTLLSKTLEECKYEESDRPMLSQQKEE